MTYQAVKDLVSALKILGIKFHFEINSSGVQMNAIDKSYDCLDEVSSDM